MGRAPQKNNKIIWTYVYQMSLQKICGGALPIWKINNIKKKSEKCEINYRTIVPTGDGQKRPLDNPLQCSRGVLDQPGSMDKPQIVCQMTLSQTLLFEPPGAHSRATGMNERVPTVMGMLVGMAVVKWRATWPPPASGQCGRWWWGWGRPSLFPTSWHNSVLIQAL